MELKRTTSTDSNFTLLCGQLDRELHNRYGKGQEKYNSHNILSLINTVVVGYINQQPVACGCFRPIDKTVVELKRMFVRNQQRGKGLAKILLKELEQWCTELGYTSIILETGKGQPEAVSLYLSSGYTAIENYGPYKDMPNSICMRKRLSCG